jgi:nucleotide-binding universal stress UspA family protein
MDNFRSILLHLDDAPSDAVRIAFARSFAMRHEARLSAMFTAAPPPLHLAWSEAPAAALQPMDPRGMQRARSLFDDAAARAGSPAMQWLECERDPLQAFCRQALYADLLVLGQPADAAGMPSGFVESVLVGTGRPALVLPAAGLPAAVGHSVLIGWNATPSSARALTASLPLLRDARRVHVLEVDEPALRGSDEPGIAQYLRCHGIEPTLHRHRTPPAEAGEVLLSYARTVDADLLVMGCYGRSRAREFVLGGASRSVLRAMQLPVLMVH